MDVAELHRRARSADPERAYDAVVALGERGVADDETCTLLINLVTSDLSFEPVFSNPWSETGRRHVSQAAVAAIGRLGPRALELLIERIGTHADGRLLERAAGLGRPLLDLARILVTDGAPAPARAAEAVIARCAHALELDEALGIYLVIAERERAAPALPAVLRALWQRLGTAEARQVIAARWHERGLEDWIAAQLEHDRTPVLACALGALLVAAPIEAVMAEALIGRVLAPLGDGARWAASEGMLMIHPERLGDVLRAQPDLYGWAVARARAVLPRAQAELELRLVIACSADPGVFEALVTSRVFTRARFLRVLRDVGPPALRAALVARRGDRTDAASYPLTAALLAIDGVAFTGKGTDED